MLRRLSFIFGFIAVAAAGCTSTTTAPAPIAAVTPTPSPTPTPTPSPTPLHLYVGNDNTPGSVLQFNLPLTMTTTSNFAVASNNVVAVAVDASGNLAVGDNAGNLQFFTAPLSGASVPSAAFKNGAASNNGQIAFTSAGDFWAGTVSNRANATPRMAATVRAPIPPGDSQPQPSTAPCDWRHRPLSGSIGKTPEER